MGETERPHSPAPGAAGDRRGGIRSFTGNGPGKATFTGH